MRVTKPSVLLLFLGPTLVLLVVLRLWPALAAFVDSLYAPRSDQMSLENYRFIFSDPVFRQSLMVSLVYSLIVNPLQIAIALMLALLLNTKSSLIGLWRTLVLLPAAVPLSVSAVIWGIGLRPDGPINALLITLGIEPWVGVGYWMTFLLAGLQEIPKSLYEAVRIDGANRWQTFRYVTLPQLRRTLTFVLVANTVANFLVFAPVQILTQGGPRGSTNLIMNEIFTLGFVQGDRSSAAAATVVLVAVVLVVVLIQFRLMKAPEDNAA